MTIYCGLDYCVFGNILASHKLGDILYTSHILGDILYSVTVMPVILVTFLLVMYEPQQFTICKHPINSI